MKAGDIVVKFGFEFRVEHPALLDNGVWHFTGFPVDTKDLFLQCYRDGIRLSYIPE